MKKSLLTIVAVSLCLTACQKHALTAFEKVAQGDPIKPVMITGEGQSVFIEDFVPTLSVSTFESIVFNGQPADDVTVPISLKPLNDYSAWLQTDAIPVMEINSANDKGEVETITIPILPLAAPHCQAAYLAQASGKELVVNFTNEPKDIRFLALWQNKKLDIQTEQLSASSYSIKFDMPFSKSGRSFIRLYSIDDECVYNDILLPLDNMHPITSVKQLNRHDDQSQVLYSLMIDRFNNGDKSNDRKLSSPEVLDIVDYQGGDIKGITQKIESGFFDELGITTIWLSPITQNPWDAWGCYIFQDNDDGTYNNKYDKTKSYTRFSGYHGYWPIFATAVDVRFGTADELRQLLATAHKHNMNVILDYVANHMHIHSPTLTEHPDWHTDSILPDGRRNFELWDEARLTTWFDTHIPTLDLERKEVYEPMTDSATFWMENFEFDGFRHDACKHIPEVYWRTLTRKLKERVPDRHLWMIGETYGSPDLIGSYVKTGMLNAQFDFNVYFTAIHAIADADGSLAEVNRVITESLAAYGAHHTMGNISGNHDQVRFISLAGGAVSFDENGKEAGWTRECGVGNADVAYRKALLLEVLNLTIPGVPCIYQGDEYGQPGGNDPDNRLPMRFDNYTEQEKAFRQEVSSLVHQRRENMALLYGEYLPVVAENNLLCFKRVYLGEQAIVAINTSSEKKTITVDGNLIEVEPLDYVLITTK